MIKVDKIIPYVCMCGITLSDKSRSLKQHLKTARHLNYIDPSLIIEYSCICGTILVDKHRLSRHIKTIKHLNKVGSCPPHYWSIASANGPTSAGTCSKCAETRHFDNSLQTGGGWFLQMAEEKVTKENQEIKELEKLVT